MRINFEDPKQRAIILSVATMLVVLGLVLWHQGFDLIKTAGLSPVILFFGGIPYFLYRYKKFQRLKKIEEALPGFLRDITESHRSGLSLIQAIINASRTDYGALTDEIKKMAAQLSWGIPFPKVIRHFSDRMKESDYIQRSMGIIMEAYKSGGDITEAMDSVAENAQILKDLEADRISKLSQQVMIMYVIFFIFLGMLIALHKILTPLFSMGQGGNIGGTNFMQLSYGPSYYRNLFFNMVMIQAFFNGLLAGQLGEGSVIAGLKHTAVLIVSGLIVLTLFLPEVVMNVEITQPEVAIPHASVWELKGSATYVEGDPVANADVTIRMNDVTYRTTTDGDGLISYRLKMPDEPSSYQIDVTVTDKNNKHQTETINVVVN